MPLVDHVTRMFLCFCANSGKLDNARRLNGVPWYDVSNACVLKLADSGGGSAPGAKHAKNDFYFEPSTLSMIFSPLPRLQSPRPPLRSIHGSATDLYVFWSTVSLVLNKVSVGR